MMNKGGLKQYYNNWPIFLCSLLLFSGSVFQPRQVDSWKASYDLLRKNEMLRDGLLLILQDVDEKPKSGKLYTNRPSLDIHERQRVTKTSADVIARIKGCLSH